MSSELIKLRFSELSQVVGATSVDCVSDILKAAQIIIESFSNGNKILICGNGGSAADAQHFATEFMSTFSKNIKRPGLPAIALSTDTSLLTAFSNDYNFEGVFARQVEALGNSGDVLIAITTSGGSRNCIAAAQKAQEKGLRTIALTSSGAQISAIVDVSIEIPSNNTQHIQEAHVASYHIICELAENSLQETRTSYA